MTNHSLLARPAQSAIAAALALVSTPLIAQTASPAVPDSVNTTTAAPPPILVQPQSNSTSSSASPGVVFAPSSPVVQAVPPVAAVAPAEEAEVSPTQIKDKASPSRLNQAETRRAALTRPDRAINTAPATHPAIEGSSANNTPSRPKIDRQALPALQSKAAAQAASPAVNNDEGESTMIALGLGAIALLFGGALVALRRRPSGESETSAPLFAAEAVTPIEKMPQVATSQTTLPFAYGVAPLTIDGDEAARREAMVAQAPDQANPFLTRKNRLRRADYMLRQANQTSSMPQGDALPKSDLPAAHQPAKRDMEINFGQRSKAFALRPPVLRPGMR